MLKEADPLEDDDIYANEREKPEEPKAQEVDIEQNEFEDDISEVLDKQFSSSKKKNSLVKNIPELINKSKEKKTESLFQNITEEDIMAGLGEWTNNHILDI